MSRVVFRPLACMLGQPTVRFVEVKRQEGVTCQPVFVVTDVQLALCYSMAVDTRFRTKEVVSRKVCGVTRTKDSHVIASIVLPTRSFAVGFVFVSLIEKQGKVRGYVCVITEVTQRGVAVQIGLANRDVCALTIVRRIRVRDCNV